MKIINKSPITSKSDKLRILLAELIQDTSKAGEIEFENDLKLFRKFATKKGYAVIAQKQYAPIGGWLVWIKPK